MLSEKDLKPHQLRAKEALVANTHFALFYGMGMGKTVSVFSAINHLMFNELEVSKVLIVGPKRVASTVWAKEFKSWEHLKHLKVSLIAGTEAQRLEALQKGADVYVISRDNLCWLIDTAKFDFDMLVLDELTSFKNWQAKRFKALKKVRAGIKRVVGLTGTPSPEGLIDLWAQMYLIDGGKRLGKTITGYRSEYFQPDKRNGAVVYSYKLRKGAEKAILGKIKDLCLADVSDNQLSIPECVTEIIDVELPYDIMKGYKDFEREKVLELVGQPITAANAATLTGKLSQYANGAVYYDDSKEYKILHTCKINALKNLLQECDGNVIVAYWFLHDKEVILSHLKDFNPVVMEGEETVTAWNCGAIKVLLVHPMSAGHGLNLQEGGNRLIWFGLTASQELNAQLNKRLQRPGQKNVVKVQYLCVKNTQDEKTIASIFSKNSAQDNFIEGVKALINKYKNN